MDKFLAMFNSKKFTVAVVTMAVLVLNSAFQWNIGEAAIDTISNVVMTYLGGQSLADALTGGKTSSTNKGA